jgi:hypothetical protein
MGSQGTIDAPGERTRGPTGVSLAGMRTLISWVQQGSRALRAAAGASLALALCGCAPVDVAGTYTGAVTNRENACNLPQWTVGNSSTGISMVVTQSGADVTAEVQGLAALALNLFAGNTDPLRGTVNGSGFAVGKSGTRAMSMGACAYTGRIDARATLSGNALEGTVTYRYVTNNVPDCGSLSTCSSVQAFSFSRPPR